jgi:opacity protein-like surface antigen
MRNTIRAIRKVSFFVFVLVAPALAQSRLETGTPPAAAGPDYDVSVGYTYLTMAIPAAGHANLNGLDVSGRVDFNPRWGAMVDSNYVRTPNVLGTKHEGYLLSLHTGPMFYPVRHGNTRAFLHVLAGVGMVDGAVPVSDTEYFHGWQARFSYAMGGGVEHSVSGPFAVRVSGDYLRTAFLDSLGAVRPQNNFRVTASFVFRLRDRQHRVVMR